MMNLLHTLNKKTPFHVIMEWVFIFVVLFAVQPNLAQASSCLDEPRNNIMMHQSSPCEQGPSNEDLYHHQSNQLNNCCNLGLLLLSFSSSPSLYKPINHTVYAINLTETFDGFVFDLQDPLLDSLTL